MCWAWLEASAVLWGWLVTVCWAGQVWAEMLLSAGGNLVLGMLCCQL